MDPTLNQVREFYTALAVNCNFVCNINHWDLTPEVNEIISHLHPDVTNRYYGSGIVVPEHIEGKTVLDLGCGSGSLVFILSKLVGSNGKVVGIDATPSLIAVCMNHEYYHHEKWEFVSKKNTEFQIGNAKNLSKIGDKSFDVVVSNGLICLVSDKDKVFQEAYRVLKDGGEFYLSDVYAEKPPPPEVTETRAWDLGVLGSQVVDEFYKSAERAGFTKPYLTFAAPVQLSEAYQAKLPGRRYCGAGHRMFRLGNVAKRGPASVTYKGNIEGHKNEFQWDVNLTFKAGQSVTVDGDLATILANTRYKDVFDIVDASGSVTTHKFQSPFRHLDDMSAKGKEVSPVYELD